MQQLVRQVSISNDLVTFVSNLVRATRPQETNLDFIKEFVQWGAGPRAGQALILTAKARALINGRYAVVMDDLQAMALPVLRHRILLNFKAEAENVTTDKVSTNLLQNVKRP